MGLEQVFQSVCIVPWDLEGFPHGKLCAPFGVHGVRRVFECIRIGPLLIVDPATQNIVQPAVVMALKAHKQAPTREGARQTHHHLHSL